ncbi:MAG: hypothetical protein Q9160_000523 [Pyrenula sp. 1 TL-2023]
MSIDIEWERISSGADGQILAESIRSFIHDKFQQIVLPRFIRSVEVHSFDFGNTSPELEIKDICDPLPDFYEHDDDDVDDDDEENDEERDRDTDNKVERIQSLADRPFERQVPSADAAEPTSADNPRQKSIKKPPSIDTRIPLLRPSFDLSNQTVSPFPRSGTPGIPGGTSNLSYFHLPLGGISGAQTPLAAVASGTSFPHNRGDFSQPLASQLHHYSQGHDHYQQTSSPPRPSTADSILTAVSPGEGPAPREESFSRTPDVTDDTDASTLLNHPPNKQYEPRPEDLQIVCHVKYAGDVRLSLTAEILLDYPMPSFVGIPLKLSITGLTFDGVAMLAHIRKRAHFCFLSPEDAHAAVGERAGDPSGTAASAAEQSGGASTPTTTIGGLLQEIHVESEIGRKENGKQVLKNVGKVERFVLEQVRRIFEEEFVFPSFWTFLV